MALSDDIPKPLGIENKSSPLFATVSGLLDNLESKLKKTDVNGVATSRNKIGYKQSLLENWFEVRVCCFSRTRRKVGENMIGDDG